ncbi:ASOMP-like protein [Mya arenaria]|uniref:ASOMP-like protein n=1 Tax=Mya arenaria TaxID=6604 RepID=A0ABY7E5X5_MYAAR|nr:ASOMP-like protein [Mya arenaria]
MCWKLGACLAVYVTVLVLGVKCADMTETVGGITTKVLGQSGKIQVYKEGKTASTGVTITMDAIKELTSNDTVINSHEFNTFANQDFTFSSSNETQYPDSDVNVTQFNFMSNVSVGKGNTADGMAKLTMYVYIFSSDGNITVSGQNYTVKTGMMKFNVKIEDWPFCGSASVTCTHGNRPLTGTSLDLYIEIKGQGSQPNYTDVAKTYDLGNGATVVVPKEVVYTNASNTTTEMMSAGYPKLEINGSKSTFIFRFRMFQGSALYDPTVDLGDSVTPPTPEVKNKTVEESGSGVKTEVVGKSGKITFSNKKGKSVTVELDSLKEKGGNDAAIQDNKHNINTFAKQDFTFRYGTSHSGDMKFTVDIKNWKFCGDSGVTCTPSANGTSLDLDIIMKGKGGGNPTKKTSEANSPDVYDLGDGMVYMSKKI